MVLSPKKIANVQRIIGVLSGKGGVGKSSIAVSIAVNLHGSVGILDADIFGPSIPKLLNLSGQPEVDTNNKMQPMINYNIKCMSMGFLTNKAVVWRGLMVMKALQDMIWNTSWGHLDYLVIDFPPGTGDAQLTIMQQLKIDGCVVVSTPQKLSLIDAQKGIEMLDKLNIPVLGLVKNMSYFKCPSCQSRHSLFPDHDLNFWKSQNIVELPFDPKACSMFDNGQLLIPKDSEFSKNISSFTEKIQLNLNRK
eukprot:NODE_2_length_91304_cov_0.692462.p39 type:complete len:250 gc:universal NODE_2_length_91304_cov_0.692462:49505-50254(+)